MTSDPPSRPLPVENEVLPGVPAGPRTAGIVVGLTLASRILGYVRDMLIAWSFGAGIYADAFIVAFRLPNLFRRLVGEGALGMAFMPIFHGYWQRRGRRAALGLAADALRRLALILTLIVVLGLAAAPLIVRGLAPGFAVHGGQVQLTVCLTRIMLPYLLLVGLVALCMGILNALGHFTAPALAPLALNLAMIGAVAVGAWGVSSITVRASVLAASVLLGGVMQLALQVPALAHHGITLRREARSEPGLLEGFGRSVFPILLGGAAYQVNVLLGTLLASYLAAGSVSYLFYADRLVQFPLGLFAVSAVTVVMPDLSRQAALLDLEAVKATLRQSLQWVWFVIVPAMVGLIVLREPIVALLFERGAFGSDSTRLTAYALLWYSTGLWAYGALRILLAVFYALQDAYRPLKVAAVCVLVNLVFGLVLMPSMGHGGIALAAALSAALNVVLLSLMLRRKIGPLGGRQMMPAALRTACCTLLMGGAVYWLNARLGTTAASSSAMQAARLAGCVIAGFAVYAAASYCCGSRELRTCTRWVVKRKKRS
jgi:putative peptidoglycan lipid II flippase